MNEDELKAMCPTCDGWGQYGGIDGAGYEAYYECHMCNGDGNIPKKPAKKSVDKHDFDDVALF